jgi:hypothetical protein
MLVSMRDWLPEDDLRWFALDVVEEFEAGLGQLFTEVLWVWKWV